MLYTDLVRAAFKAVACLDGRHAADRFTEFAAGKGVDPTTHDALWRAVMLRSNMCALKAHGEQKDDSAQCWCTMCARRWLGEDWWAGEMMESSMADMDTPLPKRAMGCCFVYPSYEYHAQKGDDAAFMQQVHDYLVRMRKLPAPLPSLYQAHAEVLPPMPPHTVALRDAVNLVEVRYHVQCVASGVHTLLLVLCGHGMESGTMWLSDGTRVTSRNIEAWLTQAGFTGTLVCVINTCHAGPGTPESFNSGGTGCDTFTPNAPFRWVVIHSCDAAETMKPDHALHVAKLLGELLRSPPTLAGLQDEVDRKWVALRDPGQHPRLWRGPPIVTMSRSCMVDGECKVFA